MKLHSFPAEKGVATRWHEHVARWKDCRRCPLCSQRSYVCLARGQVLCDVMICGEAPGRDEDMQGQPFVGLAGKLLDDIVEWSGLPQEKVKGHKCRIALTNLVACYPLKAKNAGTNRPEDDEILACRPRLEEFVALASPKIIVAVGELARDWLDLKTRQPPKIDGTIHQLAIVHPAYMLRQKESQKQSMVRVAVRTLEEAAAILRSGKPADPPSVFPWTTYDDDAIPF